MQYFGRAIGSVSKTWNSINPATLSGAIDVIVVEDEEGVLHCSPFHVRFGKFQLLRPSQKRVNFIVNGESTDIPMKLSDEGEAFFVFETDGYVPKHLQTSPVVSPLNSPNESPRLSSSNSNGNDDQMEYLDIGEGLNDNSLSPSPPRILNNEEDGHDKDQNQDQDEEEDESSHKSSTFDDSFSFRSGSMSPIERARSITMKLNIPSRVEANGDIILDMDGYKSNNENIHNNDILVKHLLQEEFGNEVDVDLLIKEFEGNIRIINPSSLNYNSTSESSISIPIPTSAPTSTPLSNPSSSSSSNNNSEILIPVPSKVLESQRKSLDNENNDNNDNNDNNNDNNNNSENSKEIHFKTLRLTSEQLKCLPLSKGENDIKYSVNEGKSIITCKLFLWDKSTPIVISDIDGTITRSDALGHVFTIFGKDWTHEGVAKLFDDIEFNGYNIMYLTARSVGLADTTRSYLQNIEQDGIKLPSGPVILSPDRTIAALRREIVLKKPEVFKMACLNDIRTLYYPDISNELEDEKRFIYEEDKLDDKKEQNEQNEQKEQNEDNLNEEIEEISNLDSDDFSDINTNTEQDNKRKEYEKLLNHNHINHIVNDIRTPFYAGFGNRITDAISYRSVGIPSSRIFTINPDGDVRMELLEMAGYKSSYVSIIELVDQFFPPVEIKNRNNMNKYKNNDNNEKYDDRNNNMRGSNDSNKNSTDIQRNINSNDNDNNGKEISDRKDDHYKYKEKIRNEDNFAMINNKNKYTDFSYWRSPDIDLSLISDDDENGGKNDLNNKESNENDKSIIIDKSNESSEINENKSNKQEDSSSENRSSRFSFFLRSPLSSPRKSSDSSIVSEEEVTKELLTEEDKGEGVGKIESEDESEDEYEKHREEDYIDMDYVEEGDEDEDEEEDSDYVYETSEDEAEEEEAGTRLSESGYVSAHAAPHATQTSAAASIASVDVANARGEFYL